MKNIIIFATLGTCFCPPKREPSAAEWLAQPTGRNRPNDYPTTQHWLESAAEGQEPHQPGHIERATADKIREANLARIEALAEKNGCDINPDIREKALEFAQQVATLLTEGRGIVMVCQDVDAQETIEGNLEFLLQQYTTRGMQETFLRSIIGKIKSDAQSWRIPLPI